MTKKYPSQEMDRFNVRMPAGMRDEITKIAELSGRSMNSEIVQMLQDALDASKGRISLGENEREKAIEGMLVKLRRHTHEQDMLINELVRTLDKK
ncbi:Arc family DNA-binding protein [Xenorhabdus bovienii]|uniref:Arc family DNA-binding protein n=1 Tax=Xenorhabdus bovienii TaxID=40576 RepID=UPI0023B2F4EA|nr:Arc family DNA-binding protein [Xenorhabdus bovienii]MDE9557339.1 Arc family DNA-binding protein [Xenorhabdus bovienii]